MNPVVYLHLSTIVPVLILGPFILLGSKGTPFHKTLGKGWVVLMISSCLLSFGIRHQGGFSWLHGLSLYTLFAVSRGVYFIRKGDLKNHRTNMIGSYVGTFTAFLFALHPERFLGSWVSRFF